MSDDFRDSFNKLVIGGCGTQVGLFLTCSTFGSIVLICMVCALSGIVSITLNNVVQEIVSVNTEPQSLVSRSTHDPNNGSAPVIIIQPEGESPSVLPETGQLSSNGVRLSPMITADQGRVNLRLGPGTNYPKAGLLPHNESLEIIGQSPDKTWWMVATSDGLAWVYDGVVNASNIHNNIPTVELTSSPPPVAAPILAAQPESSAPVQNTTATEPIIAGTPTPSAAAARIYADQTVGYKRLHDHLAGQPVSKSFSPYGDSIAVMEGKKLHLVAGDGSYHRVLLDSQANLRLKGDAVWSPDGDHLAFVVEHVCPPTPCHSVGLFQMVDEAFFLLVTPDNKDADAPRWTQDGHLLVNVHPAEPASGIAYIYDINGRGRKAEGLYRLSSSHDGQQHTPWFVGRSWMVGSSERADGYYE